MIELSFASSWGIGWNTSNWTFAVTDRQGKKPHCPQPVQEQGYWHTGGKIILPELIQNEKKLYTI